jgi:Kef-type K+ transport system membrane component KefB
MNKTFYYILLLVLGMLTSQILPGYVPDDIISEGTAFYNVTHILTYVLLGYIMIEVGLEFDINKSRLASYGKDALIALSAAGLPWLFCVLYFLYVLHFHVTVEDAFILSLFASPTSAGVLFTMLLGAGLGTTWVFKKARILAIFDDIATIMFLIILPYLTPGSTSTTKFLPSVYKIVLIAILFILAYRFLHRFKLPTSVPALLCYSVIIWAITYGMHHGLDVELEVLLPAFFFGCMVYFDENKPHTHSDEIIDNAIKFVFLFLVGFSLPKINFDEISASTILIHTTMLTIVSNIGKCFPIFCYKKTASLKERIALSVALFPRGEVGAGILLIAMKKEGLNPSLVAIAGSSLALNLVLTGVFIYIVKSLIVDKSKPDSALPN